VEALLEPVQSDEPMEAAAQVAAGALTRTLFWRERPLLQSHLMTQFCCAVQSATSPDQNLGWGRRSGVFDGSSLVGEASNELIKA
jgi:hypothetical protein